MTLTQVLISGLLGFFHAGKNIITAPGQQRDSHYTHTVSTAYNLPELSSGEGVLHQWLQAIQIHHRVSNKHDVIYILKVHSHRLTFSNLYYTCSVLIGFYILFSESLQTSMLYEASTWYVITRISVIKGHDTTEYNKAHLIRSHD